MGRVQAVFGRIADITGWIALAFLAFMMVGISMDVVVRAIWGRSVPGLFEMSEMAMVMVVFMGLGWTLKDDAHIRVTMLSDRLPEPTPGTARRSRARRWPPAPSPRPRSPRPSPCTR